MQPYIAQEREHDHDQPVVLQRLLKVAVKYARDGPGHPTARAFYAKYIADQAERTA